MAERKGGIRAVRIDDKGPLSCIEGWFDASSLEIKQSLVTEAAQQFWVQREGFLKGLLRFRKHPAAWLSCDITEVGEPIRTISERGMCWRKRWVQLEATDQQFAGRPKSFLGAERLCERLQEVVIGQRVGGCILLHTYL